MIAQSGQRDLTSIGIFLDEYDGEKGKEAECINKIMIIEVNSGISSGKEGIENLKIVE